MTKPVLYDYFRSSACYRVRIALNLKGIAYERVPVNLLDSAQKDEAYRARNPQALVPSDPADRAHVLALALAVACDIHPLNNLRVLKYLSGPLAQPQEARDAWYAHWISEGLAPLEALAAPRAGRFLFGHTPT